MRSKYLVKELLREGTQTLLKHNVPRASREAQLLLMFFLHVDELWLILNQNSEIEISEDFFECIARRSAHEPLEYITNKVSFYSEEFYIDAGALIPRPETELLIDEIEKQLVDKESAFTFVEVGIGSGIISIMLAKKFKNAKIIAVDISQNALDVAQKNIDKFGLSKQIELRQGSLLEPINEKIDYLVSNPPYIANGEALELNLAYEPQNALFGGDVGDEIIKELLDEALKQNIKLFSCEIGYDQKDKIHSYLKDKHYKSLEFYKDYSKFDRGFTLKV